MHRKKTSGNLEETYITTTQEEQETNKSEITLLKLTIMATAGTNVIKNVYNAIRK